MRKGRGGGRILEWAKREKWDQTTSLTRLATWGVGDEWFPEGGKWQQKSEITTLMSYRNDIQRKLSRLHWGKKRNLKQEYARYNIAMARHWVFKSKNDLYMILNWSLNESFILGWRWRILVKFSLKRVRWKREVEDEAEKSRGVVRRGGWWGRGVFRSDTRNSEFCEISCRWTRG